MDDHVDYDLMKSIRQYYEDNGRSLNAAALHFQLNRSKVRKMLITLGVMKSRMTEEARRLREEGHSIREIADELGCSISTVSTYLPYDKVMYKGKVRSLNAIRMEHYHKRVKNALAAANKKSTEQNGAEKMAEKREDSGILKEEFDPGVLKRSKCQHVVRLHLELVATDRTDDENDDCANTKKNKDEKNDGSESGRKEKTGEIDEIESREDETVEELHRYGGVQYGDHISRDILVPGDLQLWALHYVIQRAFGWQNSHLHRFYLPEKRFQALTGGKVGGWANLVGLIFRSPLMDENARFWADDYDHGSIKTWLRKKYTGPYYSLCQDESFWYTRRHFKEYQDYSEADDPGAFGLVHSKKAGTARDLPYAVRWVQMDDKDGTKRWVLANCCPESEREEIERRRKRFEKTDHDPWKGTKEEVLSWKDLPLDAMNWLYEGYAGDLLERLNIAEVLMMGDKGLPEEGYPIWNEEGCLTNYQEVINDAQSALEILGSKEDTPMNQPQTGTLTKTLFYEYDFGDGWTVKLTGSYNCADLIESGRVTQEELDEANLRVRSTYRPVMIARDGIDLVDDLGGYGMIPCFVRAINGDFTKDNEMYEDKESTIDWAKSLGWSDRNVAMRNRL